MRDLVNVCYLRARKIRLVQDHLNPHDGISRYKTLPPEGARRVIDNLEFQCTPEHGSSRNMAQTEINSFNRQCLDQQLDRQERLAQEAAARRAAPFRRNVGGGLSGPQPRPETLTILPSTPEPAAAERSV